MHTCGKWTRGYRTLDIIGNGKRVCSIHCDSEHPAIETEAHANARLIAAAPDLLEACKLMFGYIEDGTLVRDIGKDGDANWGLMMMRFVGALNKIQAAISKAERGK